MIRNSLILVVILAPLTGCATPSQTNAAPHLMEQCDRSKDGKITEKEALRCKATLAEFRVTDVNRDGFVTLAELTEALAAGRLRLD
ncbi:MAG: hypothetical protein ABJN65_06820 [Parasphingorhabdus sp.]